MAFDWPIEAVDYEFKPEARKIAVGDTVTWTFATAGHTSTSLPGQPDSWNSRTREAGTTFQHVFTKPGRYQYVCLPHEGFDMKGVIEVGDDMVSDTFSKLAQRRTGRRLSVSFKLNEAASLTFKLRGPTRKTVRRGRLEPGNRSIALGLLKPGTYRGTLTLSDDFDNKATGKTFTVIR